MGSLEHRLARLEERFRVWHGPVEDEERARLVDEAITRLSKIELAVFREVLELKADNPGLNDAERWRLMTDTQRAMEWEWRRLVREVRNERTTEN